MKIIQYLTIFLSYSCVLCQFSSSEEDANDFAIELIERVERNRGDCPNLPERSSSEQLLKRCTLKAAARGRQTEDSLLDKEEQYNEFCSIFDSFIECSTPLITEMINCGKNHELVTIIGLVKGSCQYEKAKGLETLTNELLEPCHDQPEFQETVAQCAKEDFDDLTKEDFSSINTILDAFCPFGKMIRKCASLAFEQHCPETFVELSSIYQTSRRLSGSTDAFDSCLSK